MNITAINGSELEKSRSNSPEDFFNRSEITYKGPKGNLKSFYVIYLRYFDEKLSELTPFSTEPIYEVEGRKVYVRDIVALLAMMNHPDYQNRHRLYISDEEQYANLFQNIEVRELEQVIKHILIDGSYEIDTIRS